MTLPFLGRALGPTGFGIIAFAQIILQYLTLLTDFGFNLTATRRVAASKGSNDLVSKILTNTSVVRFGFALTGSASTCLIIWLSDLSSDTKHVAYIAQISIFGSLLTPAWLFHGLEKNGVLAAITGIPRVLMLIPFVLFINKPDDLVLAAYLQFAPQAITGLLCVAWIYLKSPYKFIKPSPTESLTSLKDGFHVFSASILTSAYANINGLIIKAIHGDAALGIYSAAEKLVKAITSMVNPAIQAIYPKVCSGAKPNLKPLYISIFFITVSCWIGALILGQTIIKIVYGDSFEDASKTLMLLTIAPIFSGASAISVQLKILATGNHQKLKSLYAISALSHFIHAPILIWYGGTMGAAVSVCLTEIVTLISVMKTASKINAAESITTQ